MSRGFEFPYALYQSVSRNQKNLEERIVDSLLSLIGEGQNQVGSDVSFYVKVAYANRANGGLPDSLKYVPSVQY